MIKKRILITGGAGFIGSNLANYFLAQGCQVKIYDSLARARVKRNIEWLHSRNSNNLQLIIDDIRNFDALLKAVEGIDIIYHLAGQVAVTTSISDPRNDFEINSLGTLNVLEAAKIVGDDPILIFTSTNKVYGEIIKKGVLEQQIAYAYHDSDDGVSEEHPLDFHSPYGCSKGAADQYVRDYARIYDLKTVVLRMSCIYGPRQFGTEDQGWVAHFIISSLLGKPLIIYGDGKQVRDILFIDDLIRAFELATRRIEVTKGQIYNIGGGKDNSISLLELISQIEELLGRKIKYTFAEWRPGDQKIYISDIGKAEKDFGWKPLISKEVGIRKLFEWIKSNQQLFE